MTREIVNISIDEIAMIGFDGVDTVAVREAVRVELQRLAASSGRGAWPLASGHTPYVKADTIEAGPDAGARDLGVRLARSVGGGLTP